MVPAHRLFGHDPAQGVIRQVGNPLELSVSPAGIRIPPPTLAQDTDAILSDLGYDSSRIATLRTGGIV